VVFWLMTRLEGGYQRVGETCHHYIQGFQSFNFEVGGDASPRNVRNHIQDHSEVR
jgi:hypothetical protein